MNALDAMSKDGSKMLPKCYWGCMSGDHTAYVVVHARSEDAARTMLPANLREKAKIQKVDNFTAAQIASFHNH